MCVDDHPLVRDGISFAIENAVGMEIVGEASNGPDALSQYRRLQPDILLVDIQLPVMNGIEVITTLKREYPRCCCIVLTTYDSPLQAIRAIRSGARGYLLKTMARRELLDAIRLVHQGGRYFPQEIIGKLEESEGDEELSVKEIEILRCVADGLSNHDIGEKIGISENTVKSHLKTLNAKLRANDRTHAVLLAMRRGFLDFADVQ